MKIINDFTRQDIERSLNIIIAEFITKEAELPYCVIMSLNYYIKFIEDSFSGIPAGQFTIDQVKYKDVIILGVNGIEPDCLIAGQKGLFDHVIKAEQTRAGRN